MVKASDAAEISNYVIENRDKPDLFKCLGYAGAIMTIRREADKGKFIVLLTCLLDRQQTKAELTEKGFVCNDIDGGSFEILQVSWYHLRRVEYGSAGH